MSLNPEYLKEERNQEWRAILRSKTKNKDRILIPRVKMPELAPEIRVKYQDREVNMGLEPEQAQKEATRCMDCSNPTCIEGCPVTVSYTHLRAHETRHDLVC